jgi:alpha/beta superfamily hydrolase
MAIVSLVFGLLGICFGLSSPLAILWGHWGRSKIANSEGRYEGSGMAIAGLIFGYLTLLAWGSVIAIGISKAEGEKNFTQQPLAEARKGFQTQLAKFEREEEDPAPPPAGVLELVLYPTGLGPMAAYVSPNPQDGQRRSAVVWVTGGFSNSIGPVWEPATADNDQTASVFRESGCVMMYPSFRGGNRNPGSKEGFMGEVDDLVSAIHWLKQRPYVDADRIYLGGHSTGGTLVLLAAAADPGAARAVFSFGPVNDPAGYGRDFMYHKGLTSREAKLRAPENWVKDIRSPTLVIEGEEGNVDSFPALKKGAQSAPLTFIKVTGQDHFTVLQPASKVLAQWIKADTEATPPALPSVEDFAAAFTK